MDEILFRLSNQFEALQIQTSVTAQNFQQIVSIWLSQGQQFLLNISNDLYGKNIKEIFHQIFFWFQKQIQSINRSLSYISFNPRYFYHQLKNLHSIEVSKKEFFCFLIGLLAGSLIGYSVALNWYTPRHLHHMKAIVCNNYFGTQGVTMIEDAEMSTIQKSNELLVQVKAASIHDVDIKICSGYSKFYRRLLNTGKNKGLPVILGRDCAGVVVDIGCNVIDFDIGDKVFLAVPSWSVGTMAEYIVVPENHVAKMPKILPFEASATLPYSGCIAWDAIVNHSIIKEGNAKGKRVLVYGGSTPVGCILIQLIKLWGGYIVTICRSEAAPIIKALGADEIILMNESDISKELECRDKYDAIFYTEEQLLDPKILKKHLLPYGSYVSTIPENLVSDTLGFLNATLFSVYVRIRLLLQHIFGSNISNWKEGSKLNTAYLQSLQELADADQLQPILDRVYAPHCIDKALCHVMDSNAIGSTVIKFQ